MDNSCAHYSMKLLSFKAVRKLEKKGEKANHPVDAQGCQKASFQTQKILELNTSRNSSDHALLDQAHNNHKDK